MTGSAPVWAVTFLVDDLPGPQGSKNLGVAKNGRTYVRESSAKVKPWRKAVTAAAYATGVYVPPGEPVTVEAVSVCVRDGCSLVAGRSGLCAIHRKQAGKARRAAAEAVAA